MEKLVMTTRNIFGFTALLLSLAAVGGASADDYYPQSEPEAEAPIASDYADSITFPLERSPGIVANGCVPYATGTVTVTAGGPGEVMDVSIQGLPAYTEFAFFVTQLPNPPFGLSWYQGDVSSDEYGNAKAQFIGRFNQESFILATGAGPAPLVHEGADAIENPTTKPIHTFHIGMWFDSAEDAAANGCPGFQTPFNGDHTAGVQLMNTASFPDDAGPLSQLKP
jgi:hypothetical protein